MSVMFSRAVANRWAPYLVLPVLAVLALPAMAFSSWVTLTLAGLAMGMMLFLMASGLTLIFGLMDVLNFAHAAFVTLGAYLTVSMFGAFSGLVAADSLALNLLALGAALLVAAVVSGAFGLAFEHVIIRRVYGSHLQQILITVGGLIVAEQLIVRGVGRRAAARRQAGLAARQLHRRRRGDREVSHRGGRAGAAGVSGDAPAC